MIESSKLLSFGTSSGVSTSCALVSDETSLWGKMSKGGFLWVGFGEMTFREGCRPDGAVAGRVTGQKYKGGTSRKVSIN